MSGPICPDCGMFESNEKGTKCSFCNWKGDPLPRRSLALPELRAHGREQRRMRKLRSDNKLFFLRIYVKDPDTIIDDDNVWMKLMEKLEINTLDDPAHEPPYFFIKVKKKPTDEILDYIRDIPGVLKITIY